MLLDMANSETWWRMELGIEHERGGHVALQFCYHDKVREVQHRAHHDEKNFIIELAMEVEAGTDRE